ncbi:MAG TPA: A/G-specific adenine glycosylase [Acidimicrobiales bacterium]|nr:A/G-specific adenine glycosylase [Acidimicrobiales bacterium]
MSTPSLHGDLLDWWRRERRDLPWRRTRDPWAVLVSEAMLQQTQVSRVVPRYAEFLKRFPDPASCAAAPVGDVLRAWAGLGYNRRAVHLHRAASAAVAEHGGRLPDDLDALMALPGVGPYTARAVLVFAHERDLGLVDTNAGRFLARAGAGRPLTPREAQARADELVPPGEGWAWGQAVFDLGATICRRRSPRCETCPVRRHCAWASAGWPDPDPVERSAGVSTAQAAFAGSDRQGRGRLVAALRAGPVASPDVAATMGWSADPDRAEAVVARMLADGLVAQAETGDLRLP